MFLTGQQIIDLGIIENPRPKFTTSILNPHKVWGEITEEDKEWFNDYERDDWCEKHAAWSNNFYITLSGGIEPSAYGLTIAKDTIIKPREFVLANTAERLSLPSSAVLPIVGQTSIVGNTVNKSTWARLGLLQPNTDMEAGWSGHLTLELFNASDKTTYIPAGAPIVTARFSCTFCGVDAYAGKYQDQPNHPVEAK